MITYSTITEAIQEKARLRANVQDLSSRIFRMKRDDSLDDDTFDEERLKLNGEIQAAEDQIAVVDAWVEEKRADEKRRLLQIELDRQERGRADKATRTAKHEAAAALAIEREKTRQASLKAHEEQAKAARERRERRENEFAERTRTERDRFKDLLRVAVAGLIDVDPGLPVLAALRAHEPALVEGVIKRGCREAEDRLRGTMSVLSMPTKAEHIEGQNGMA